MECPSCGRQQDPSNKYCEACGGSISSDEDAPISHAMFEQPPAADTGTANMRYESISGYPEAARSAVRPVVPPQVSRASGPIAGQQLLNFRLAHGEQVLKAYDVVTLRTGLFKRQRGHGTLYVTDARVIFYALVYPRGSQKASSLFQQTKLEDISGLSANVSRRVSLGLVVLTLCSALATLGTLVSLVLPLTFLFAILTVVLVIAMVRDAKRRGDVGVLINSRENGNSPIAFGHLPQQRGFLDKLGRLLIFPIAIFLHSYSAFDVIAGDPGDHANELLHELGALIIDLQTRGTMAYPEWSIAVPAGAVGAATAQ
jgi:hypothetical protein